MTNTNFFSVKAINKVKIFSASLLVSVAIEGSQALGSSYQTMQIDSTVFELEENWNLSADTQNALWSSPEAAGKSLATMAVGRGGDLYFAAANEWDYHTLLRRSGATGQELSPVDVDWGKIDHSEFATSFVLNDTEGNVCVSSAAAGGDFPLTVAALDATMGVVAKYTLPIEDDWYIFSPVSVYGDVPSGDFSAAVAVWTRPSNSYVKEMLVWWDVRGGVARERSVGHVRTSVPHIQMLDPTTALVHDRNSDATDLYAPTAITSPTLVRWEDGRMSVIESYPTTTTDTYGSAALLLNDYGDRPLLMYADCGIRPRFRCVALTPTSQSVFGTNDTGMWTFPGEAVGHVGTQTDLTGLNQYDRMSIHAATAVPGRASAKATAAKGEATIYTYVHRSGLSSMKLSYRPATPTSVERVADSHDGGYTVAGNTLTATESLTVYDLSGRIVVEVGAGESVTLPTGGFYIVRYGTESRKLCL